MIRPRSYPLILLFFVMCLALAREGDAQRPAPRRQPPPAEKKRPVKKPSTAAAIATRPLPPAVKALLTRAKAETPEKALATLEQALRAAGRDRAALLSVALTLQKRGVALSWRGTPEKARAFLERALSIQEKHGASASERALTLYKLGDAWAEEANKPDSGSRQASERAGQFTRRALVLCDGLAARGQLSVGDAYIRALANQTLGSSHFALGRYEPAKVYLEKYLALNEKLKLGPIGPSVTAWTLLYLAKIAQARSDNAAVRRYTERILALPSPPGAAEDLGLAEALIGISEPWHVGAWDPAMAYRMLRRAASIYEKRGTQTAGTGEVFIRFAGAAFARGEEAEGNRLLERGLSIYRHFVPTSMGHARALALLGSRQRGDLAAARRHYEQAVAIAEKAAPGSLDLAGLLSGLGLSTYYSGDFAASREYGLRALALTRNKEGGHSSSPLFYLGLLASTRGNLAEAREYYRQSAEIRRKTFTIKGEADLWMTNPLQNLGGVELQMGNIEAARKIFQQVYEVRKRFGPGSVLMAGSLQSLGDVARRQGDLAGARSFYEQAIGILERNAGVTDGNTYWAMALTRLALVLDETGERGSAIARQQEALAIIDRELPESGYAHNALTHLAKMLLETGETEQARRYLERARAIQERLEQIPFRLSPDGGPGAGLAPVVLPAIRFAAPVKNAEVRGNEVALQLAFLSPISLSSYRLWVNGRPFGPDSGFDLPELEQKQAQDSSSGGDDGKGRILDKGRVLDKGRILDKGEQREQMAKELPADIAELIKKPEYSHFQLIRHSVPVEETDGEYIRVAVQARTKGGSVSHRQILRLRNPRAEKNRGSLRVLAIGVSQYEHLPKLSFAAADALALGDALKAQGGEGKLYKGADITIVTDAEVTLARIQQDVEQFTTNVRPGDTLILHVSGHGIKAGEDTYFAPVRFDPENVKGTGLLWKDVLANLEEARKTARSVWVLADACRQAPGMRRDIIAATARDLKQDVEEGGNLILCTASSGDSPSYESEDLGHGIFTRAWLDALRGEGPAIVYEDTPRGKVLTLSGLQFALDFAVRGHARNAGVRQQVEFPRLEGSFSPGMPVFAVPAATAKK